MSSADCIKYYQSNENDQPIYSVIDLNAKGLFQKVFEKKNTLVNFQYFVINLIN